MKSNIINKILTIGLVIALFITNSTMVHASNDDALPSYDQATMETIKAKAIEYRDKGYSPSLTVSWILHDYYGYGHNKIDGPTRFNIAAAVNYGHRPGYFMDVQGNEVLWSGKSWTDPATGYVLKLTDSATENHSMSDILMTGYEDRLFYSDFTKAVMAYTGNYAKFYQDLTPIKNIMEPIDFYGEPSHLTGRIYMDDARKKLFDTFDSCIKVQEGSIMAGHQIKKDGMGNPIGMSMMYTPTLLTDKYSLTYSTNHDFTMLSGLKVHVDSDCGVWRFYCNETPFVSQLDADYIVAMLEACIGGEKNSYHVARWIFCTLGNYTHISEIRGGCTWDDDAEIKLFTDLSCRDFLIIAKHAEVTFP